MLYAKYTYQSTLSTVSNVYRLEAQHHAPTNDPLGVASNNLANHKLASECIKVRDLGRSVCT